MSPDAGVLSTENGIFFLAERARKGKVLVTHSWCTYPPPPSIFPPLPPSLISSSYNDVYDEHRATNLLISADEAFADVHTTHIGVHNDASPHSLSLSPSSPLLPLLSSFLPLYSSIPLFIVSTSTHSSWLILILSSSSASQQISWILLIQVCPRHKGLSHRGSQVRGEQRKDCNMYLSMHHS